MRSLTDKIATRVFWALSVSAWLWLVMHQNLKDIGWLYALHLSFVAFYWLWRWNQDLDRLFAMRKVYIAGFLKEAVCCDEARLASMVREFVTAVEMNKFLFSQMKEELKSLGIRQQRYYPQDRSAYSIDQAISSEVYRRQREQAWMSQGIYCEGREQLLTCYVYVDAVSKRAPVPGN